MQLKELQQGDPEKGLNGRRGLLTQEEGERDGGALKVVTESLEYLEKRRDQLRYAGFLAAGLPIGSGAVESGRSPEAMELATASPPRSPKATLRADVPSPLATCALGAVFDKLVVEFRLKGSGMHWAREHVNPMVALGNVICSDRWDEAWAQIVEQLCKEAKERAEQRRVERAAAKAALSEPDAQPLVAIEPTEAALIAVGAAEPAPIQMASKPVGGDRRPADNHPWRRMPIGRARAT